jgi:hypothetical protein
MAPAPGKSCGSCTMCCKVLEIDHFKKPAGKLCQFCTLGSGCTVYESRPEVCRDYECLWLTERDLGAMLKPDRIGTILMEDPDTDDYLAVCDPTKPLAWRNPLVFKHLVAMAKDGHTVIAKAGMNSWRVFESGAWAPWV